MLRTHTHTYVRTYTDPSLNIIFELIHYTSSLYKDIAIFLCIISHSSPDWERLIYYCVKGHHDGRMGGASRSDSYQRHDAWTTHRGVRASNSARARAQQYEIKGHLPAFSRTTAERDPMDGWSGIRHSVSCATGADFHVSGQWQFVVVLPSCLSLVGMLFVTQCPVLPGQTFTIRSMTVCGCSSFLSFIGWSVVRHSMSCASRTKFHVSGQWQSVIVLPYCPVFSSLSVLCYRDKASRIRSFTSVIFLPSCPVVRHTVSCATGTDFHVSGHMTVCDYSSFLSFIGWSVVRHSMSCATRTKLHE